MDGIMLPLVGSYKRAINLLSSIFVGAVVSIVIGSLLDKLGYSIGNILLLTGINVSILCMLYLISRELRGISARETKTEVIFFCVDNILVDTRQIDFSQVRVITADLAYKGGNSYGSARTIADGTENRIRLVYRDLQEEKFRFYLKSADELKELEQILKAAKQRHSITLIL